MLGLEKYNLQKSNCLFNRWPCIIFMSLLLDMSHAVSVTTQYYGDTLSWGLDISRPQINLYILVYHPCAVLYPPNPIHTSHPQLHQADKTCKMQFSKWKKPSQLGMFDSFPESGCKSVSSTMLRLTERYWLSFLLIVGYWSYILTYSCYEVALSGYISKC